MANAMNQAVNEMGAVQGRLAGMRAQAAMLRSAGRLAAAVDLGRALCVVCREVFDAGEPGTDWERCRRLFRQRPMLARVIDAATQPPVDGGGPTGQDDDVERALIWLARVWETDPVDAFRACRDALLIYERWCAGDLAGVFTRERAEVIAGLREAPSGTAPGGTGGA